MIATLALAATSFAAVTVTSPAAGSTSGSPIHFVASASSSHPITTMRIYVDNVSVFVVSASKLDTSIAMGSGTHNVMVQAWDSVGTVFKTPLTITVSTAAPPPPPGLPAPPSTAVVKTNIEQMTGWSKCAACAGTGGNGPVSTLTMLQNQASPSLDGNSTKFSISGITKPYSDALWWKQLGAVDTATNLKYDLDFYLTNPGVSQALEFDSNQANGKMRWIYGTQCNIKGGHWDVWGNAAGNWISTGIACSVPTAFKWHHLTWEFKRTATTLTFVGFTYDGVTHYVNRTYPGKASSVHELNVAFQMDADSQMHAYSTWVDRVTLTYW